MKQAGRKLIPLKIQGPIKALTIERLVRAGFLPIMSSSTRPSLK